MKNLNIAILSGGSGNDALIKGLKKIYPDANIRVVVNAYDNGKSTGICRAVTGTLGVSDIRKNHSRMYEVSTKHVDMRLKEFYDGRYTFTPGKEIQEIKGKLSLWGLSEFDAYVDAFFENENSYSYFYKDFSVANIIYSQMYKELGYEETNRRFCELLGIEDFVVLNSFDNVFINAVTESGAILQDEGDIVEHCNPNDKIVRIFYTGDRQVRINPVAKEVVLNADLLIISTGTFWSSIYPTLEYGDFYQVVNKSPAKKIWAMNCTEDKDAYGVTNLDFMTIVSNLGLDLDEFTVLLNSDADPALKCTGKLGEPKVDNIVLAAMENNNGKHNGDKYAKAIFRIYYGISSSDKYDKILFDFDDTIWARDKAEEDISIDNLKLLNEHLSKKICVISGNTYESIVKKLFRVFGTELKNFNIDIWADANSVKYVKGKPTDFMHEFAITGYRNIISYLKDEFGIDATINSTEFPVCLKIKPLGDRERKILASHLNHIFESINIKNCVAVCTGSSTIDIISGNNNKDVVLESKFGDPSKILYIGDEVTSGNDKDIAKKCSHAIHTTGVKETNMLIRLLIDE